MDDSFPLLLNLPNKALMKVLRNMEHPYQLGLSILSKRAMNLVKSLNLKAEFIGVRFSYGIELTVHFADFYRIHLIFPGSSRELILLYNFHVRYTYWLRQELYNGTNGWIKPEYQLNYWIHHILSVFNCSKVDDLSFWDLCDQYDIQSVYNIFKECTSINIGIPLLSEYSQSILKTFNSIKIIQLSNISSNDHLHDIFIRNFDVLIIQPRPFPRLPKIRLNDLLTLNNVVIEFHDLRISEKELNGFIKHWINGSNPRMEALFIKYPNFLNDEDADIFNFLGGGFRNQRVLNENVILNKIDYQIIQQEHERTFESSIDNWRNHRRIIKGGYDIQRKDGTTATIVITNWANDDEFGILSECKMEMFVWD